MSLIRSVDEIGRLREILKASFSSIPTVRVFRGRNNYE